MLCVHGRDYLAYNFSTARKYGFPQGGWGVGTEIKFQGVLVGQSRGSQMDLFACQRDLAGNMDTPCICRRKDDIQCRWAGGGVVLPSPRGVNPPPLRPLFHPLEGRVGKPLWGGDSIRQEYRVFQSVIQNVRLISPKF